MKKVLLFIIAPAILILSCKPETEYKRVVDKELASGKRYDSLFMGLRFGMSSKQFFAHCWEMNKKGLFTDGANNTSVLYNLKDLKAPASMNFYPDFINDKIYKMRVTIKYDSWAPWHKQFFADSLQHDVLRLYKKWYGDDFMQLNDPQKGPLFVKVDGNRRIIIGRYDDLHVKVDYTDLLIEKELLRNNRLVKN